MDPPGTKIPSTPISYEPISVKELLVEMKDTAELLIDLAYAAVLLRNEELAAEVLRLEARMDVLEMRARMSIMMAARNPTDAERLAPVLGILTATDHISDAAGDIASIVLEETGLPEAMRAALPEAIDALVRGVVGEDSPLVTQTLEETNLGSATGVRVIAIRRGEEWILNPGPESRLEAGDVTFLRGPESGLKEAYQDITGHPYDPATVDEPAISDLGRAIHTILAMKNRSELAVDLAYSSVLFDSEELASEVSSLEQEIDELEATVETWTLRAAADVPDPTRLRGLIHLASATERIGDAAVDISEGVLRELDVHPVVELAVAESDEVMIRIPVDADSELVGATVVDGVLEAEATVSVLALRRPDEGWLLIGDGRVEVQPDDVIIAKGTRTASEAFGPAPTEQQ